MNLQFLADGLIAGLAIGLGAVGLTLTQSILRFANFAQGEFLTWGCYLTLTLAAGIGTWSEAWSEPLGSLSIGWNTLLAGFIAMALTGVGAIVLDAVLFKPLRRRGAAITAVIASFGASMALRALVEAVFSSRPAYLSRELQIAVPLAGGLKVTPDQLALAGFAAVLVAALHLLLTRTHLGRSMRAVGENPTLAGIVGIDVARVVRLTWFVGGALACAAGIMMGLVVQIRPTMGSELLLPMFAAATLGGIGSVPGALIGGLIVGLSEAAAVNWVGAEWRAAVAFALLIAVLLLRPNGLQGTALR
jgi:branched-chain amino acid transport system permease protein